MHGQGLQAHAWTFANEWTSLYWDRGQVHLHPHLHLHLHLQDPYSELEEWAGLGVDGVFADFPLTVRRFLHYTGRLCARTAA